MSEQTLTPDDIDAMGRCAYEAELCAKFGKAIGNDPALHHQQAWSNLGVEVRDIYCMIGKTLFLAGAAHATLNMTRAINPKGST